MENMPSPAGGLYFKGALEPLLTSGLFWVSLLVLAVWILAKVIRKERTRRPFPAVLIYGAPPRIISPSPGATLDYSITPEDPRFPGLPWEHREALYVRRIRHLDRKCHQLRGKLEAAGVR